MTEIANIGSSYADVRLEDIQIPPVLAGVVELLTSSKPDSPHLCPAHISRQGTHLLLITQP